MKQKKYIFFLKALFLSVFTMMQIFLPGTIAFAITVDKVTDNVFDDAANFFERRYHLNKGSLQDQGENFNVSSQKGQAPQVLLYFTPSDPKPGEEVEARAFPEFFGNSTDTLYYTWYLKRKRCSLTDRLTNSDADKEKKLLCDRNDDDKITVEDWKIEAMQAVAARDFDSTCALNGSLSEEEREECAENMYNPDAKSRINVSGSKGTDRDKDGYIASVGGDGRSGFAGDCSPSDGGEEESDDGSADPFDPTSEDTGAGRLYASSTIGGTTRSVTLSSSQTFYEIATGFSDTNSELCYEIYGVGIGESHGEGSCSGNDNWRAATEYISSSDSLIYGGGTWTRTIAPVSAVFPAGHTYHLFWRDSSSLSAAKLTVSSDGSSGSGNTCTGESVCYIHDFGDGYNYELPSCQHLFPDNYKMDGTGDIRRAGDIGADDCSPGVCAEFPIDEERFWRTDPEDPSTAQNGTKDEANLAGLGADTFRWVYAPEDKVGVAVEGVSMYNTKYDNSSAMVMWALPKNKCDVTGKSTRTETIKGYSVAIKTATTNINDCLEDNLVDPTEGGQAENVDLSLSYTPNEPSAKLIPWGENAASEKSLAETGDMLVVNAASSNANRDASFANYLWRVQASGSGTFDTRFSDENVWVDITKDLQIAKNISATSGNGVNSLSINLNLNEKEFYSDKLKGTVPGFARYFNDDVAYFRISASATENFSGQTSRSGSGSVVVKVVANKSIDVYHIKTETDASTGLVRVALDTDTPLCPLSGSAGRVGTSQQVICPVLKNQVVGVFLSTSSGEIRDYAWTLDGKALACSKHVSEDCDDSRQGATNFFPVSGEVGDLYTLSVVANNAETGRSFTVTRRFQVVSPDADLVSEDGETAWPKILGSYTNLDGSTSDDVSKTSFEGIPGSTAKFSAVFRPEILGTFILDGIKAGDDQNEMIWSINGKPFKWNDTGLSLALDGTVGDIYTVTLSGAYNQPRELRKALYDIWKISPFNSETVRFSKEIQIRLVTAGESPYAKGGANTFFASLISAVPPLVLFSVRLILSMGLILLVVGVAFSAMPERRRE